MHLQWLPIKKVNGRAGYIDNPLLNTVHIANWMPTLHCVALLCIQLNYGHSLVCRLSFAAGHRTHMCDGALHLELV
jgi:hypothetical protein